MSGWSDVVVSSGVAMRHERDALPAQHVGRSDRPSSDRLPPKLAGRRILVTALSLFAGCSPSSPHEIPETVITTAAPDVLKLVVVGDIGKPGERHAAVAAAVAAVCASEGCDLVVFTGDNVYPRGAQSSDDPILEQIFSPYASLGIPVMAVLGNHDWGHGFDTDAAEAQVTYAERTPTILLPAPDHIVQAGPATLVGVDTTRVFWDLLGWRSDWAEESLAASDAKWRVLVGHHPFRSDGPHGDAGRYEGWRYVPWMSGRSLAKLFERAVCGHADLYLAGHDHSLQHLQACGRELVVSGAGASTTPLSPDGDRMWGSESLGFAWIQLADDFTLRFHDQSGRLLHTYVD